MAGECDAAAPGQQCEAIGQAIKDLIGREHLRPDRRKFDGEREAVEAQEAAGWEFRPPGGESRRQQLERSRQALIDAAGRGRGLGDCILVVTHEGVIKGLAHHLSGRAYIAAEAVCLRPYHLHWLTAAGGHVALAGLNGLERPPRPTERIGAAMIGGRGSRAG